MAAALRFAARKICGRALQRPPQPCLTAVAEAAIKEEQRQLLRHGGSSLRRFSSESQNLVKNNKLGATPDASSPSINHAQTTPPPPLWSPRNKMFLHLAAGYVTALCASICGILYYRTHEARGPFLKPRRSRVIIVQIYQPFRSLALRRKQNN